jgi:hypothetical protein
MSIVIFSLSFLILLALIVYAVRRRGQHSFLPEAESLQFQSPRPALLFAPTAQDLARIEHEKRHFQLEEQREKLLSWATLVDFSALKKRPIATDEKLLSKSWNEALEILTERATSEQDIGALVSFALENKFNVNKNLIASYRQNWECSPDPETTTRLFELLTLADDAELFTEVLNEAWELIKTGKLQLSRGELYELAGSHYWLLSPSARTSGAGFLLRQRINGISPRPKIIE